MQYAAFVMAIFGVLAWFQASSLQKRVTELERALTKMKGTSFHEDRAALVHIARSYIGEKVQISFKEDLEDADIINYGNTKHGFNTILDADEEWLAVRIVTPKGTKEKLIRMETIERISVVKE